MLICLEILINYWWTFFSIATKSSISCRLEPNLLYSRSSSISLTLINEHSADQSPFLIVDMNDMNDTVPNIDRRRKGMLIIIKPLHSSPSEIGFLAPFQSGQNRLPYYYKPFQSGQNHRLPLFQAIPVRPKPTSSIPCIPFQSGADRTVFLNSKIFQSGRLKLTSIPSHHRQATIHFLNSKPFQSGHNLLPPL
jgi:hypothetical protein